VDQAPAGGSDPAIPAAQHVPVFYRSGADHEAAVSAFVLDGLRHGHTCICVCQHNLEALVAAAAAAGGDDAGAERLRIRDPDEFPGLPSPAEEIAAFVAGSVGAGRTGRGSGQVWIAEELSSRLGAADVAATVRYEAFLHEALRASGSRVMSLYDLGSEGREFLAGAVQLHRHTLVGATVIENVFHVEPSVAVARVGR